MKKQTQLPKRRWLFLSLLSLLMSLTGTNSVWADELTIANGSNTNSYCPFDAGNADYAVKGEYIIPSTDLTAMNGKTITAIKLYANTNNTVEKPFYGTSDSKFQIFMKEVANAAPYSLSSSPFQGTEGATTVYEGTLTVSSKEMLITFTNTYVYNGGNLLIGFYKDKGGHYLANTFTGVSQANYTGCSGYSSSGISYITSGSGRMFIPKTTFTYEETSGVAKPTNFELSSKTFNSATFTWTNGGEETEWQIAYKAGADFDPKDGSAGQTVTSAFTDKPYTLTGLTESTTYYAYLRAKSGEVFSNWSNKVNFTTPAQYPAPTDFALTDYAATTATFGWTNGSSETAWQIAYSTDPDFDKAAADASSPVSVSTNPYTLEGLTAETTYYAFIRADYESGHYSAWSDRVTFKPSATKTLTVNDGSTTNSNIPVYGNWVDDVNYNKSQFVIPSTSLTTVNGRDISKLTFYTNASSAIPWTGNVFDIYMKEVNVTTVSTSLDRTGTKVFTGSLSVAADGKMEITLGESFPYEGGNLQISFDMTTKGSYSSTSFYGVTGTSGCSMYTSNSTGTSSTFLPKITIESVPSAAVAVKKPKSLETTSVLATSATLSWTDGEDGLTEWEIKYDTETDFDPDTEGTLADADANPFTVTELTAETTYYAYVRAKKGGNTSDWSNKVEFTTPNAKPSDIIVAASDNSAKFSWTANAGETAWQLVYSTDADFDKSLASPVAITTNPYTLTGLVPETTYYAYLRADLGGGNYSDWTAKQTFTTGFEHELTVNEGNGSTTSGAVPFSGYDTDNAGKGYGQFIIPASQLGTMNGGQVNKITFYTTSNINWSGNNTPTFKVYLKEVDNEKFASKEFVDWATMTEIYDGEIVFDGKQLTINLATPHNYTGKNLMIGFKQTAVGGYCTTSWVGTSAENEVSVQNASGATTYNWGAFLPKTTFSYETVTGPRLEVSTDALDFGELNQESTDGDKQKTFTISNTGVAELTGLSVAVSGAGYSVSVLPRTNITTEGANATPIELTVTLAPTTSGTYNGTVTVSATGQPDKVINLTATYVADPIMGVFNDELATEVATTGETVNFGYVESAPTYTYYIKNTGAGTLDVAVTDGGFTVSPAEASLAAGAQQAFTITPNVANADATVTFTGTNHDGGAEVGTFAVTLQGTVMPLTSTFFEGFAYAAGDETPDATTTELPGWEINNNTNNIKFYHSVIYYYASSTETANVVTPKLRVAGTSDVLRVSAYTAYTYSSSKLIISYSADKTNWTVAATKVGDSDFDGKTYTTKTFEISGIPEGSYYFKIEMCDVAVDFFYGFSTTHPAALALNENAAPSLVADVVRDVTLTRNFVAGWNTICLPFAVANADMESKFGTGAKLYDFTGFNESVLSFEQVNTGIAAGKPYLIYVANAIADPITFWNATISETTAATTSHDGITFQGTYAPMAAGSLTDKYGISKDGRIAKANANTYMNGFRAYLVGDLAGARISTYDEATGISRIYDANEVFGENAKVYNLNGQKVENAKKGVYIVNGKKVVIK